MGPKSVRELSGGALSLVESGALSLQTSSRPFSDRLIVALPLHIFSDDPNILWNSVKLWNNHEQSSQQTALHKM